MLTSEIRAIRGEVFFRFKTQDSICPFFHWAAHVQMVWWKPLKNLSETPRTLAVPGTSHFVAGNSSKVAFIDRSSANCSIIIGKSRKMLPVPSIIRILLGYSVENIFEAASTGRKTRDGGRRARPTWPPCRRVERTGMAWNRWVWLPTLVNDPLSAPWRFQKVRKKTARKKEARRVERNLGEPRIRRAVAVNSIQDSTSVMLIHDKWTSGRFSCWGRGENRRESKNFAKVSRTEWNAYNGVVESLKDRGS